MMPVFEIMHVTPAISNLIREGKTFQIENAMAAGGVQGMTTMDQSLALLVKKGVITKETAMARAYSPEGLERRLR